MGYEIDFLPVGDGTKGGDAIVLRYGNLHGQRSEQTVVVVDGGTKASGAKLVDHIQTLYKTDRVDLVISTHPDGDHVSGLTEVLENMTVGTLLMHRPWEHSAEILDLFRDGRLTETSLEHHIMEALQAAHDVEEIALSQGIPIVEPFQGDKTRDGVLTVLGPSEEYYLSLIPDFRETPKAAEPSLAERVVTKAREVISYVGEKLDIETLDDSGSTSAENNSSVILLLRLEERNFLLTGDAGMPALSAAADFAEAAGLDLSSLSLLQVPHHGSQHNVGPTILNRIKGRLAYISAPKEGDPKHPSRKVVNALIRRGSGVHTTQGIPKVHYYGAPERDGWVTSDPLPFFDEVEV